MPPPHTNAPARGGDGDSARSAEGYVYLIHHLDRFKIGVSVRPDVRLWQVAPDGGAIVHLIPSAQPYALEAALHRRFAPCALGGEWFALTPDDVALLRALTARVDDPDELPHALRPPAGGVDVRVSLCFPAYFSRQLEYVAGGLGVSVERLVETLLRAHLAEYRALADKVLRARDRAG